MISRTVKRGYVGVSNNLDGDTLLQVGDGGDQTRVVMNVQQTMEVIDRLMGSVEKKLTTDAIAREDQEFVRCIRERLSQLLEKQDEQDKKSGQDGQNKPD